MADILATVTDRATGQDRTYAAEYVGGAGPGTRRYGVWDVTAQPAVHVATAYSWLQVTASGMGTRLVWAWAPKAESGHIHPSFWGLLVEGLPSEAAA